MLRAASLSFILSGTHISCQCTCIHEGYLTCFLSHSSVIELPRYEGIVDKKVEESVVRNHKCRLFLLKKNSDK